MSEKENQENEPEETIPRKVAASFVCAEIERQQLLALALIVGTMFTYGAGLFSYQVSFGVVGISLIVGIFFLIRIKKELKRLNEKYGV